MLIQVARWLTFVFSLSLLLIYFKGGSSLIQDVQRSSTPFYTTLTAIMAAAGLTLLVTQLLVCLRIIAAYPWADRAWLVVPGALLAISGIALGYWIRYRYLGIYWSSAVEVKAEHKIIETGPYRLVRHPIYAITPLIYTGIALAFALWWVWLACATMLIGYVVLTAYEDAYLATNLPGYQAYQQRTRYRYVPGIW